MELMILILAYWFTNAVTDGIAVTKGRTPPSHDRWLKRHQARRNRPAKPNREGRGFLPYARRSWDDATERWAEKSHQRHLRKLAWIKEAAPTRNEAWLDKQRAKVGRRARRREAFANARGVAWDKTKAAAAAAQVVRPPRRTDQTAPNNPKGEPMDAAQPTVRVPDEATRDCTALGCLGVLTPIPGDLHVDERDGTAMVGQSCDTCAGESTHHWTLPGNEYRAVFGHPRDQHNTDETPDAATAVDPDHRPEEDIDTTTEARNQSTNTTFTPVSEEIPAMASAIAQGPQAIAQVLAQAGDQLEAFKVQFTQFIDQLDGAGWSGAPLDALQAACGLLGSAQDQVTAASNSITTGVAVVGDAYDAQSQVGDKESVMASR